MIDDRITPEEAAEVLPAWGIAPGATLLRPGSGTANASALLRAGGDSYVLRRRNPRYSSLPQLQYDHSVIAALGNAGLPVPVAVLTVDGDRWYSYDGHVYELCFYIDGEPHDAGSMAQIEAAGDTLGRMHEALRTFEPEGRKPATRLFAPGPSREGLLWAMHRLRETAACVTGRPASVNCRQAHDALAYLIYVAETVAEELPDRLYWSLPATVVHGDYHPGNLLFRGGGVAGVFDFDWVSRQPRMADITDGLMFFAGVRETPLEAADIRSLTQAFRFDVDRMRRFMAGYERAAPVGDEELAALPALIRARWLYVRVDAMMRKVPEDERLEFLLHRVLEPLTWVDEHEAELRSGAWRG